ncbi:MAG TPA: transporter substrate-binding domain-containing protein [Actinomycetota bacterium]|jgi:polar amino acid transport system substrate-binding protein|nr:transporter substrate-binding domain-containing protein [Actinomycetota bacterium]
MKLGTPRLGLFVVVLALVSAACGEDPAPPQDGGGTPAAETVCASHDQNAGDLLARICTEGVIRVSTDPAYPPQSELNPETGEYEGFDIDVANEIASRLGVEVEWETPKWGVLTAGSWNDRWDMSVGSMTPTNERQQVLEFTEPYSFVPAVVVVPEEANVTDVTTDLDGATIGVCADCTYQFFLEKSLAISGYDFNFVIDDATVQGYDTDTTALQDLALGRLDAVMTSVTTAKAFVDEGNPVKIAGDPLFGEPLAIAFDKDTELDNASLVAAVDEMVAEMHSDGTLTELSEKWYDGVDVTKVD